MQKRYVIYSAMVGAYDDILQPKVVDERFDYILFSNEIKEKRVGIWEVRPIIYHNDDNTRICRYVKTHSEELLKVYEVSVWMDSSIQILTSQFYQRVIELDEQKVLVAALWHPAFRCIYDEAFAVMHMRVEYEAVVVDWCHRLRKEKYPQNNGLCETGIVFRKHLDSKIEKMDALWWQCIEQYSRRDQLSFNYALWKCGVSVVYFLGEGGNVRESKDVCLTVHNDERHNICPLLKNEAWLMRHCWKHKEDTEKIEELYFILYGMPFPQLWIALAGQYYRLIDRIRG